MKFFGLAVGIGLCSIGSSGSALSIDDKAPTQSEAIQALQRAVEFYRTQAGFQGAYLYRYSADLKKQEGEGKAHKTTGWTQPPGTPSVGEAYLKAWKLTGQEFCLNAAREAAYALVNTQLRSGGWDSRFELHPEHRRRYAYRADGEQAGKNNVTTFDDNKSQSALMFLMHFDEEADFKDAQIHEAVEYALKHFLDAQYPNGAWPQRFSGPPEPDKYPVKEASYPDSWPRTWPRQDYKGYYTLNDNSIVDMIDVLFEAHRIYGKDEYRAAAEKTGGFLLLAQMPEPQPGWAQQYNPEMHPAWARKFEPPAITGGESQGVMLALLDLYRRTSDRQYLKPFPRALEYYKHSLLPGGRLARFYELHTNRPLYFTKDYELTYSPDDMPTHYAFIVGSRLEAIEREYRELLRTPPDQLKFFSGETDRPKMTRSLATRARSVVDALDDRGAWVESGGLRYHGADDDTRRVIESRTFIENLETLSRFIAASRE